MEDKVFETVETKDSVLIEEIPNDLGSFWSQFNLSLPYTFWVCLGLSILALLFTLPYIFYGSELLWYLVGLWVLATIYLVLAIRLSFSFTSSKLVKISIIPLSIVVLGLGFRMLNLDAHVKVNYQEQVEGFPYDIITSEIANPLVGDSESFTISVKSEDFKFKGPDFGGLAGEVRSGSKEYHKGSLEEFKPFTIYYGSDAEGRIGDIKGKRIVNGWFGSTSTDFVIEFEK